jgi:hypothetical protein
MSEHDDSLVKSAAQVAVAIFAELADEDDAIDAAEVTMDVRIDHRTVGTVTVSYRPLLN